MKHKTKEGQAHFHVILKRRFAYYIISVYLPSLSLLMVTHWTNFISVEHFEANIMVYLTTMLVTYTLFQAISISLPQVSLVKSMGKKIQQSLEQEATTHTLALTFKEIK